MHIDDFIQYDRILYSRRFLDLFESQITSQIKVIRSLPAPRYDRLMWSKEARKSLRYAFFLRYYALFESHLKSICERFARKKALSLRLSDISGDNFLNRVNKYLTRVVHLDPLDSHRLWCDVLSYLWISNAIIHNNGQIIERKSIPQYVRRQLAQSTGLTLDAKNSIRLNRRFCYRAMTHMAQFLLDVYERQK